MDKTTNQEGVEAMDTIKIARVAHQINKAYCDAIGDSSQKDWEEADPWHKKSAIKGVEFHMENPFASVKSSHEDWYKERMADGWVYGEKKDAIKKTHPCLVKYDELPLEQRVKDYLFEAVVHSLARYIKRG